MEAISLTVTDAAKALGVTRPALSALLNEHVDLSPEMALRIEKAFGVSMDTLMRMQNSYDIARARKMEKTIKLKAFVALQVVDKASIAKLFVGGVSLCIFRSLASFGLK